MCSPFWASSSEPEENIVFWVKFPVQLHGFLPTPTFAIPSVQRMTLLPGRDEAMAIESCKAGPRAVLPSSCKPHNSSNSLVLLFPIGCSTLKFSPISTNPSKLVSLSPVTMTVSCVPSPISVTSELKVTMPIRVSGFSLEYDSICCSTADWTHWRRLTCVMEEGGGI